MQITLQIKNGELVPVAGIALFEDFLGKNDGKRYTLLELSDKRSTKQNRYLWGCVYDAIVKKWSIDLGWDEEDVHDYLKTKFLRRRLPNGEVVVGSTAVLKKKPFTEYVEKCKMEAAKHGIVIEDSPELSSLYMQEL